MNFRLSSKRGIGEIVGPTHMLHRYGLSTFWVRGGKPIPTGHDRVRHEDRIRRAAGKRTPQLDEEWLGLSSRPRH